MPHSSRIAGQFVEVQIPAAPSNPVLKSSQESPPELKVKMLTFDSRPLFCAWNFCFQKDPLQM